MSFLPINEENKEAPKGQTTDTPVAPPPASGSAGAAPEAPKGAASGSPSQFGSSASKLGAYLEANAPQIGQQAETVAGNLNQQYGNISQGITNAANQFGQQVQGGYAAPNQDVIQQAMQNPTGFASTPENVQAFQKQYNNAYAGPLTFESTSPYSDIQNQVGQAVQQGKLLDTQAGLQSYLQGQGNNPTKASSTLDALLLQGNPEAQAKIRGAAGQLGTLGGQLQTATTGANKSVLDAQKAAQESVAAARGQFDPYVQNFGAQIGQQAQDAEQQRAAYNQALNNFYSQVTPVQQNINSWLGQLYNNAGTGVKDVLGQALAQNQLITNPITEQTIATPEQYAQAQAIQQLLGGAANLPIDQSTAAQAGTAPAINPAQMPDLSSLLEAYGPSLFAASRAGLAGGSAGLQNQLTTQGNLLQYLNQFNPNYYATRAAPGQYGGGEYWGQGATYNFPGEGLQPGSGQLQPPVQPGGSKFFYAKGV